MAGPAAPSTDKDIRTVQRDGEVSRERQHLPAILLEVCRGVCTSFSDFLPRFLPLREWEREPKHATNHPACSRSRIMWQMQRTTAKVQRKEVPHPPKKKDSAGCTHFCMHLLFTHILSCPRRFPAATSHDVEPCTFPATEPPVRPVLPIDAAKRPRPGEGGGNIARVGAAAPAPDEGGALAGHGDAFPAHKIREALVEGGYATHVRDGAAVYLSAVREMPHPNNLSIGCQATAHHLRTTWPAGRLAPVGTPA